MVKYYNGMVSDAVIGCPRRFLSEELKIAPSEQAKFDEAYNQFRFDEGFQKIGKKLNELSQTYSTKSGNKIQKEVAEYLQKLVNSAKLCYYGNIDGISTPTIDVEKIKNESYNEGFEAGRKAAIEAIDKRIDEALVSGRLRKVVDALDDLLEKTDRSMNTIENFTEVLNAVGMNTDVLRLF